MLPETTRLAKTLQAWWPAILAALTNDVSNAHTEGIIIWSLFMGAVDVADVA